MGWGGAAAARIAWNILGSTAAAPSSFSSNAKKALRAFTLCFLNTCFSVAKCSCGQARAWPQRGLRSQAPPETVEQYKGVLEYVSRYGIR